MTEQSLEREIFQGSIYLEVHMTRRSNIPCKHPGCAALIPHGQMYCDEHKSLHIKDRAHAAERGYGAKWQRERKKFLESNPFCVKCYEEGHITMATVVDHIVETRNSSGIVGTGSHCASIIIM
jgi:5-methylcytosine-specific restriction protein A